VYQMLERRCYQRHGLEEELRVDEVNEIKMK
jgi:hypothetical protein